jgi:hypothetical protein
MPKYSLFDVSISGSPLHTINGFLWNIRALGVASWTRCAIQNVLLMSRELLAWGIARLQRKPARSSSRSIA